MKKILLIIAMGITLFANAQIKEKKKAQYENFYYPYNNKNSYPQIDKVIEPDSSIRYIFIYIDQRWASLEDIKILTLGSDTSMIIQLFQIFSNCKENKELTYYDDKLDLHYNEGSLSVWEEEGNYFRITNKMCLDIIKTFRNKKEIKK
tara:strand:- start:407 stop:850 length:444 start_codon:yes stop_codon:yes gene_type:complete